MKAKFLTLVAAAGLAVASTAAFAQQGMTGSGNTTGAGHSEKPNAMAPSGGMTGQTTMGSDMATAPAKPMKKRMSKKMSKKHMMKKKSM